MLEKKAERGGGRGELEPVRQEYVHNIKSKERSVEEESANEEVGGRCWAFYRRALGCATILLLIALL
jgi:hypothetical protein